MHFLDYILSVYHNTTFVNIYRYIMSVLAFGQLENLYSQHVIL
jgi:hypothetical protein